MRGIGWHSALGAQSLGPKLGIVSFLTPTRVRQPPRAARSTSLMEAHQTKFIGNGRKRGTLLLILRWFALNGTMGSKRMNGIIYLVGLVVVVLAILSFLGIH